MAFLLIGVIVGFICAGLASSKGRSPVGWFFIGFLIGLIGLIVLLCLPNLKEEQARQMRIEQENRRLREQIRQEQIKSEAFRTHTQRRLDAHDQQLGFDTRVDGNLLDVAQPAGGLLDAGHAPVDDVSGVAGWYYAIDGQTLGPVTALRLAGMIRSNAIPRSAMVWMQGMADWVPVDHVPEFSGLVNL